MQEDNAQSGTLPIRDRVLLGLTDLIGPGFVRVLGCTWRVDVFPADTKPRIAEADLHGIFAFWHCHLLSLLFAGAGLDFAVPVSEHRDGEYVARIMSQMGFTPVRGSATRGGLKVLRGMMRAAEAGLNPAITPDGPKGPRHAVLPGIIYLGSATGLPVIPLGISAWPRWTLPSWDKFEIPRPFARITVVAGDPIPMPVKLDRRRLPDLREEIRDAMMQVQAAAERRNPLRPL